MSKTMLVNVTHVEESRVAILEEGVLAAYEIETINRTSIKGNIYNAIVEITHPSLEAAFVRIGHDLKGFLPLDEVNFKLLPQRSDDRDRGKIGRHLHANQKIMVQVVREPFAGKPPTVSTFFSLPGRFLVLMPGVETAGISRKIGDQKQRDRLKKIIGELKPPEGFGIIVRTAGIGQTKAELNRDLRYLLKLWESIQKGSAANEFPGLVYRERDLVLRTIRDHFTPDISEVWIDSQQTYNKALDFFKDVMPSKARILRLYTGERPLFNKFNLEQQIESIYKRRVPLPSGGEIVIDGTEALTAIDVNSARSNRKADAEENAAQTNLEAAKEIVRQLRLRDLGGLVVVDFIDMVNPRNKKQVEKAVRDAMKGDKAKYDITRLSKLGLMEIARQRIKGEKMGASYMTCPGCEGYGLVKNIEAAGLSALRTLQTRGARGGFGRLRVELPPEVANWVLNNKREDLAHMEQHHVMRITVEPNHALLRHQIEIETFPREQADDVPSYPAEVPRLSEAQPEGGNTKGRNRAPEADKPAGGERSEEERTQAAPPRKRKRRRRKSTSESRMEDKAASGEATRPPSEVSKDSASPDRGKQADRSMETRESGAESEGDGADPGGKNSQKRKRRRRKRRSRISGLSGQSGGKDGRDREYHEGSVKETGTAAGTVIPPKVTSFELMPAASGINPNSAKARKEALQPKPRKRRSHVAESVPHNRNNNLPSTMSKQARDQADTQED